MNTKSKNIIISSYDDLKNPVYAGGGAVSVHEIARRFAKTHRVTVYTGNYLRAKDTLVENISYQRIGSSLFGHKIGQIIFQLALLGKAISTEYDIWIESSQPPFTFSLLPIFSKKPVISWVNMLASYDMQRKYRLNFKIIEQLLAKLYRLFIVPTTWVQNEVRKMNKKAVITTIPNGFTVNSDYPEHFSFKPAISVKGGISGKYQSGLTKNIQSKPLNTKYLLFMGRIEVNQKGLDLLLSALAQTKKKIRLVIAGSGSEKEEKLLKQLIKRNQLTGRVHLAGRVSGIKKAHLYKHAVATIVSSRFETFCLVALESLVYRTPVICFNIPQLSWLPTNCVYKIPAFSVEKLTQALDSIMILRNTKLPKRVTKLFLESYNWESVAERMEKVILEA